MFKEKKNRILFVSSLLLMITLSILATPKKESDFGYVIFPGKGKFRVEKADTAKERYSGLSFRESLCDDCGMLFVMPERNEYTFSMRNMKMDLDFVWIDGDRIAGLNENVSKNFSEDINSPGRVNFVLEISSGEAGNIDLKEGDMVIFE